MTPLNSHQQESGLPTHLLRPILTQTFFTYPLLAPEMRTREESPRDMPSSIIPMPLSPAPRPRITGDDIPDDIWRIIAEYLEDSLYPFSRHFHILISVNRSFFHYILVAKYREVRWVKLDRQFVRLLQRLQ